MADMLITSKIRTIMLLLMAALAMSAGVATWQLLSLTTLLTARGAAAATTSDLLAGAMLNVASIRADTELLTITQTMAANEQTAGAIATDLAQFDARMDRLAAQRPEEAVRIQVLKHREDALLRQACRGPLLRAAAAISATDNQAAQTVFLSDCLTTMQDMTRDMTTEQTRIQAPITGVDLPTAMARATEPVLAMMLGSLGLAIVCATCLLRAGTLKPLTPAPTERHADGAASPAA